MSQSSERLLEASHRTLQETLVPHSLPQWKFSSETSSGIGTHNTTLVSRLRSPGVATLSGLARVSDTSQRVGNCVLWGKRLLLYIVSNSAERDSELGRKGQWGMNDDARPLEQGPATLFSFPPGQWNESQRSREACYMESTWEKMIPRSQLREPWPTQVSPAAKKS